MSFNDFNDFNVAKSKCNICSIGQFYNRVVVSDGCKNPTVMILGEAPGADEIKEGKPFVGKAGQLLRKTLNECGFRKNNSLISNVIPCRPENNKFPTDEKLINECMERWLKNEILLVKPRYLLLLGNQPLKYLLSLTGITRQRGVWIPLDKFSPDNPIQCMPTYHPSYVLRKEYMEEGKTIKQNFIRDIKEVAIQAGFII
jgi:DNA polymerase